jgi:hypothetical protein
LRDRLAKLGHFITEERDEIIHGDHSKNCVHAIDDGPCDCLQA